MKPFSVNLSKFKKIAQDKKSTVLRDPSGHEIRVVHSALPALQRKQLEGLPMYAEGGDVNADDAKIPSTKPVTVNVNQAPPTPSAAAQFAQQPVNPQVGQPAPTGNLVAPDKAADVPAAVSLEQKAIREQQAIDAAKGAQTANIEQGYNNQKAQIAQQEQDNINAVKQHADEFAQHIAAKPINPDAYLESRTSGQKVLNAMGLILGGFKQGLVGGNNPAMDFINTQIDRDISAQKARADQQKNIYGAYRELYGDQQAATAAAKASMLDVYNHKMQQMAAQLGTPQAQANADAFAAKSVLERNQLLLDAAGRIGTLNTGQVMGAAAQPAAPVQTAQASAPAVSPAGPSQNDAVAQNDVHWYQKAPGEWLHDAANPINPGVAAAGESATKKAAEAPEVYEDSHILIPNAAQRLKQLQYGAPTAIKPVVPEIIKQFTAADQAEKAARRVDEMYPKLAAAAENGGVLGRLGRSADTIESSSGALGDIGTLVAGGLHAATGTSTNRAFQEYQNGLIKYIANALRGTNVTDATIHDFVKTHSPEYGDSPEKIEEKRREIKQFILDAPETSLLKQHGFSNRK